MNKKVKQFLALCLSISLVFSLLLTPALAANVNDGGETTVAAEEPETEAPEENATETEPTEDEPEAQVETMARADETPAETTQTETDAPVMVFDADDLDVSVEPNVAVATMDTGDTEVDTDNPVITVVEEELNDIVVMDADGESIALTDEQIQTVLYLYKQYLDQWAANADVLGVQMPFFLQYNDNKEDGLGTLGEMLVLAGYTVDDVRSGNYSYDDLVGMIQNFLYADKFGIEFYGDKIKEQRDTALQVVKDSGAQTDAQKLLVLNDWLAQQSTFDMSYIMNMGEETPTMVAQKPQKHQYYDTIYEQMYALYEDQITQQFHDQIYDSIVAQFRQQYYENAIRQSIYQSTLDGYNDAIESGEMTEEEAKAAATEAADQFMEENADAISEDAAGFVEANFGPEAAAQISAGADEFIKDAKENGVEVDPENAPGYKMTIEEITQQTMENEAILDLDEDGTNETTANQAIPIFAEKAATGLTNGILGAWEGNHIGILAEGTGVCCGYAKAYAYLVQCMYPEYYGKDGAGTDMTVATNWKTAADLYYDEDGNLDINQAYNVDLVRITFHTNVTMYGQAKDDFNSDHFWNAVKVNGYWYYVDPCYNDVYSEVMLRDRVETDGNMNHLYFMFSHTSAAQMYDGYYEKGGIKTLYADAATDKSYEDAWVSRIASNTYSDREYFYYVYDSADLITLLEDYNGKSYEAMQSAESEFKLVRHRISDTDEADKGDTDFETLIDFSYDDESSAVQVYNPESGEMEENELLTKLFIQFEDECDVYPSIKISAALYEGKLYFSLSNCILSYDLETGEVVLVKEYNTVYAKRDLTVAFGGMAFSVVDSKGDADLSVTNHPIAGLIVKGDGNLYVSIATNYAYISGKERTNCADSEENGYGYEFEESNYNPDYNSYFTVDDSQLEGTGYENEHNDNDEFMWSAVFVDTLSMSHLAGGSHSYEEVTVAPFCGRNGFTENRCTECGAIEADSRVENKDSAVDHHYVHYDETYYTKNKNDDNNWYTGDCYVCTICGYAVEPSDDGEDDDWDESKDTYEMAKKKSGHVYTPTDADSVTWGEDEEGNLTATIASGSTVVCEPCHDRLLDVLHDQNEVTSLELDEDATLEVTKTASGTCKDGLTTTYIATGTTSGENGVKLRATKTETGEAGEHNYEAEWTWTEVKNEETEETGSEDVETQEEEAGETGSEDADTEIPYTATLTLTCSVCGDKVENIEAEVTLDEENSTEPTDTEPGKTVYKATATYEEQTYTDTQGIDVPATGHTYKANWDWTEVEDKNAEIPYAATLTLTCKTCDFTSEPIEATVVEESRKDPTTTEEGEVVYKATATFEGTEYTDMKSVTIPLVQVGTPKIISVYSTVQDSVKITWTQAEGADGYELYRSTDPDIKIDSEHLTTESKDSEGKWFRVKTVSSGSTVEYRNQGLEVGQTYYYTIRAYAVNDKGERFYSDFSNISYMPAAVVFDNVYSNSTSRIRILWKEVGGSHGYQIWRKTVDPDDEDGTVYKIIKTIGDKGNELTDNQGATTAYSNTGLESGKTYIYKMRAFSIIDGKKVFGAYSNEFEVAVMPEAPVLEATSSQEGRAQLTWDAVNGAAGYQVWMATEGKDYSIAKAIADGSTTSYTKYDLKSGSTYSFKVRAYTEVNGKKTFGAYSEAVDVTVK